jgi:Fe-S-cluster containining protein
VSRPWYRDGLAFECQRCRACCRGEPGYVWVSESEIARLAAALGQEPEEFRAVHCRQDGGRTSLRERPDGDCVLLGPEGCLAYSERPTQCRTFPFWPENLRRPRDWDRLAGECPGLNRGQVRSLAEIREALSGEKGGG